MRIPNVRYSLKDREPLDKALRKFRKACEREGIHHTAARAAAGYEKPSEIRRRKLRKAEQNRAKAARIEAAKAERRREAIHKRIRGVGAAGGPAVAESEGSR